MAEANQFGTFDLGRILMTSESLKAMKRQSVTDQLQDEYLKNRTTYAANEEARAADTDAWNKRVRNMRMLNAASATILDDPTHAARLIPELQQAGVVRPDVNWQSLAPEQLQDIARQTQAWTSRVLEKIDGKRSVGQLYQVEGEDGPQYTTAEEAVGRTPYQRPESGPQGSWSQPFEAIDPMSGKPGMFQSHSVSGQIRPATVKAGPLEPKPVREGSDSTAPDSLIWRQAVAYFGGIIDPQTGNITGLDPTQTARTQQIAAQASRIYRDGGGEVSPAEAVLQAISGDRNRRSEQEGNNERASALPDAARARLKEGVVTTFANGQKWTVKNGQPVQVQ